ncbi:hypothetical protein HAX54_046391 [Datura stramonium]|uniref:Uncharacterized protein n=1 Tax=Datura stramonium TaxID=4076 RepID=A0ABS8WGW7_DATST|nr:hypothetical protein [Datura stramonium]
MDMVCKFYANYYCTMGKNSPSKSVINKELVLDLARVRAILVDISERTITRVLMGGDYIVSTQTTDSKVAPQLSEPDLPTGAADLEVAVAAGSVHIARPAPTREGAIQCCRCRVKDLIQICSSRDAGKGERAAAQPPANQ